MEPNDFNAREQARFSKEKQLRDSVLYLLPLIVGNIFPFLTLPIFTRILTTDDYGALALAQIYGLFASGIANFGMTVAYDRNYYQYRGCREKSAQLLYTSLAFVCCNFIVAGLVTFLFQEQISSLVVGAPQYGPLVFFAFLANAFAILNQYYYTYFRNAGEARIYVTYTIAGNAVSLILSLLFVAWMRIGIIGLVYAQLLAAVFISAVLSRRLHVLYPLSFSLRILRESLKLSYPLTPRIFFGVIDTQINKYMVGLMSSMGGAGIYRIGEQMAGLVFSYMTQLENVFIPQTYRKMFDHGDRGGDAIGRYLTPFAYLSILVALLIALFSQELIYILTTPAFFGAMDIVTILSMFYACSFIGKISGTQLIFAKKTYVASFLGFLNIGINISLCIPFITAWGAPGAAWATFTSGIIYRTVSYLWAQHYYRVGWEFRRLTAIYGAFLGASSAILLLRAMQVEYVWLLSVKVGALILYAYVGVKIRVITLENFLLVKNMFWPSRNGATFSGG